MSENNSQPERFLLGIGAPRSGTTWIYQNLRLSSEVYMPPVKELRYFKNSRSPMGKVKHKTKTLKKIQIMDGDKYFFDTWTKIKDGEPTKYLNLFEGNKFAGEITPIYSVMEIDEISEVYSALKKKKVDVFYMVRNPFFREISQIIFALHRQRNRTESYSLEEYRDFVDTKVFIQRSKYQENFEKWESVFRDNVKIFYFDQLEKRPKVFFRKFCESYDINFDTSKVKGMKINKSGDKNRFQIKLPNQLITYLAERSIKNIESSTIHTNKRKEKWIKEIHNKVVI